MTPYLLTRLRQSLGVESTDNRKDAEIFGLSADERWQKYLEWEGILGYDRTLHQVHDEIYGTLQAKTLIVLEKAYTHLLKMPADSLRIRNQGVYCALRDAIAEATGLGGEDVQNMYEEQALKERDA